MSFLRSSLKPALRSLIRTPALTAAAVTTLAVSIGLNTAVFSVLDAVVLRPLPFPAPDGLVALCELDREERTDWCGSSVPNVYDIAERSRATSTAGVARSWPFMLRTRDGTDGVSGGLITPGTFAALGITPFLGRLIEPQDIGANWARVVVLSHDAWQSRFGGQRDVIGQAVTLDDEPHTVVGVLPADTRIPLLESVTIWRPIHFDPRAEERRDWRGFQAFLRLKAGVTAAQLRAEVAGIATAIQQEHFPAKPGWSVQVREWQDVVVGPVRKSMYVFAGAVWLVLLIGCVNVANLLLARATGRSREFAIHAALGATRGRLVRRLLTESAVLAGAGAIGGILLGWWAARGFVALAPRGIPRIADVTVDLRVLVFTLGTAVFVTFLVGLAPALSAGRADPQRALGEGGRSGKSRHTHRIGESLIVLEIALAVILVTAAGLLVRTFETLVRWQPGFEQDHLLTTWTFSSPGKFRNRQQVADLMARSEEALRTLPAVVAVGSGSAGPLFGGDGEMGFAIDGRPAPADGPRQTAFWYDISPGYFQTLGVPVVLGRDVGGRDVIGAPLVAVINESFARQFFAGDPLGHRVHMIEHEAEFTVVGVVRDVPPVHPGEAVRAQIFWSNRQMPRTATYYLVRTSADQVAPMAESIRARLRQVDPEMQVSDVRSMRDWLGRELVRPRFAATLVGTFGVMALLLAAVGTYGLLSYAVGQRTREIGIRAALGARPGRIIADVVRRGMGLASIAILIGIVGALAVTRLLRSLLAGVTPTDPLSFAAAIIILIAATALASVIPARRASRVDPVIALKTE